jgi:DeoR/GlpR family transcriptional regulator of sugar metabolism
VIVLGGRLKKELQVAVGAETVKALQQFQADLCFLGVAGLHPEIGITVYDYEESHVKRAMLSSAAEVVALVSSEKLGTVAPYVVGQVSELSHLVTESSVPDRLLIPYRAAGLTIVRMREDR